MKNYSEIVKELEGTNSRNEKESILENYMSQGLDEFFQGVRLALDSMVTYGIKQVPKSTSDGDGITWNEFVELANKLSLRELTGNDAKDSVKSLSEKCKMDEWNYFYRRILTKDLKCGVSEKTVNKVAKKYPQYSVPVFRCQLAKDSSNHQNKMKGKKQVEVKLDGVRVIVIVEKSGVKMLSRNGKEFHNFKTIASEIQKCFDKKPDQEPFVLDGEVMSSNFQDLMKQVHRKSNIDLEDAVLHLFDALPLKQFKKGYWGIPQKVRSNILKDWIEENEDVLEHVTALDWEEVDLDTEEGVKRFSEINKQAVDGGYEGVMIKDTMGAYECDRSSYWLKMKPFIEVSLSVVGLEEGTGKNRGRLGALICHGVDDGKKIKVNVGSGLTDKDREDFWNARGTLIGKVVEVRADSISQNQDGTHSLRFPRFKTFRGFDDGEKL